MVHWLGCVRRTQSGAWVMKWTWTAPPFHWRPKWPIHHHLMHTHSIDWKDFPQTPDKPSTSRNGCQSDQDLVNYVSDHRIPQSMQQRDSRWRKGRELVDFIHHEKMVFCSMSVLYLLVERVVHNCVMSSSISGSSKTDSKLHRIEDCRFTQSHLKTIHVSASVEVLFDFCSPYGRSLESSTFQLNSQSPGWNNLHFG